MNVIGYVFSYKTSPGDKSGEIDLHSEKIRSFCEKNSLNLREIMVEPDDSRADFRPVLVKVMNEAAKKSFSGLVVHNLQVLAQEESIRKWIVEEFKKYNIRVYSAESEQKSRSMKLKVRDLPSLPEVVTRVTELVQNPKTSAAELSGVISKDSGLTSKVLRLVNSAYYGFPRQISSIQHAIMILGFTTIKGLVLSSSIFRIFAPKNNLNAGFDYKNFWKHSLLTAMASKKIYKELFFEENENIFSAAILHDIGKVILDQYDHNNYVKAMSELTDPLCFDQILTAEQKHCELTHPAIGAVVSESWNLPEVLTAVILHHHTPWDEREHEKIVTVVYLGNIMAQLIVDMGVFSIKAFNQDVLLNFGLNEELLSTMFCDIREEAGQLEDMESFISS